MVSFRGPQPSNFVPFTPNKWENFERRKENQGFKNLYIKIVRQSQLLISIDHLPLSSVTNGSLIKLHLFPFLTTLLFALQITVRDSQFFSKVTHFDKDNVKVTELPNKEAPEVNKPEQQPPFIPETMAYMVIMMSLTKSPPPPRLLTTPTRPSLRTPTTRTTTMMPITQGSPKPVTTTSITTRILMRVTNMS